MENTPKSCPFCGVQHPRLVQSFDEQHDQPLLENLQHRQPGWKPEQGVCLRCLDGAHQEVLQNLLLVNGSEPFGLTVLPTPIRLNSHPDFTGKGVTICLIDSGFYVHPDLEFPKNRIKKIVDITNPRWHTSIQVDDVDACFQKTLLAFDTRLISRGIVNFNDDGQERRRGFLVRGPDGHALLLYQEM